MIFLKLLKKNVNGVIWFFFYVTVPYSGRILKTFLPLGDHFKDKKIIYNLGICSIIEIVLLSNLGPIFYRASKRLWKNGLWVFEMGFGFLVLAGVIVLFQNFDDTLYFLEVYIGDTLTSINIQKVRVLFFDFFFWN